MTTLAETEARAPVELRLHRGQAIVHRSRAQFRVCVTGRRWGKTTLDKAECLQEFGTPGLVWFLAPTYDMARELMWEPVRALVPRAWLTRDPNETRMELDTIWGCRFACKSVEHPDRLRGRGPRKIVGDEFQDWKDGQRTWEEVLLPSLLTTNGRALLTGTPKSFNHLHAAYERGQRGVPGWASWQFKTLDAPHIQAPETRAYLAQMRAEMDPRAYRQEFEASFEALMGRAYYAFQRKVHASQPVTLNPQLPVCVSFDFNINPATAVIGQYRGLDAWVWREVFLTHAGGEATRAAAMKARQWLDSVRWRGDIRLYGDPAGKSGKTTGPSDHAVIRQVFPTATWSIATSAPHVRDRVSAVNARCQSMDGRSHLVVDPSCVHLIADLEQVIFSASGDLDKAGNPMLTHVSDALGYWCHQAFARSSSVAVLKATDTPTMMTEDLLLERRRLDQVDRDANLAALVAQHGPEAVEAIKRLQDPAFVLPASLRSGA